MAIEKKRGYAYRRPFYAVDQNAFWSAGQIAFLATDASGNTVATTAPSGTVPIGTFWKDHNLTYFRSTVEEGTFDANDQIALMKGNVYSTSFIKVTSHPAGTVYTQGLDYSVSTTNGIVTRLGGGSITAGDTVEIWYGYIILANAINYQGGTNYDRVPDDTLGSGKIAVVEGWAHIYTDQYDPTQTYTLNATLRSDSASLWTTATTAYPICGRVISVPTADDPWLGVQQTTVLS